MQLPTVPAILITLGSIIFAYVANWLTGDRLPQRTNILIGAVAVVILGVVGTFLVTGFVGNLQQDLLLVVACCLTFWQQLKTLLAVAQKLPSPLLPKTAQPQAQVSTFRSRAAGPPTSDAPNG